MPTCQSKCIASNAHNHYPIQRNSRTQIWSLNTTTAFIFFYYISASDYYDIFVQIMVHYIFTYRMFFSPSGKTAVKFSMNFIQINFDYFKVFGWRLRNRQYLDFFSFFLENLKRTKKCCEIFFLPEITFRTRIKNSSAL